MSNFWYALHVRSHFEKCVTARLEQKGYETFLPTYFSERKSSNRVASFSFPLFPGYAFCRFNIYASLPIVLTPGVIAIVGTGSTPMPLEEGEIENIRRVVTAGVRTKPCGYMPDGERVRVESGSLEGLIGIIQKIKGNDRIVVALNPLKPLKRSISVEIDGNSLRRLLPTSDQTMHSYNNGGLKQNKFFVDNP